jgi:hypothetical protein
MKHGLSLVLSLLVTALSSNSFAYTPEYMTPKEELTALIKCLGAITNTQLGVTGKYEAYVDDEQLEKSPQGPGAIVSGAAGGVISYALDSSGGILASVVIEGRTADGKISQDVPVQTDADIQGALKNIYRFLVNDRGFYKTNKLPLECESNVLFIRLFNTDPHYKPVTKRPL